jgi:hypothetical protein
MTKGLGHQIDRGVRDLDACKQSLNEAFGFVYGSEHERLNGWINEAIELAALLSVLEDERINDRT